MYLSRPGIFTATLVPDLAGPQTAARRPGGAFGSRSGRVATRGVPVTPVRPHRASLRNTNPTGAADPKGPRRGGKTVRCPRNTTDERTTKNAPARRSLPELGYEGGKPFARRVLG